MPLIFNLPSKPCVSYTDYLCSAMQSATGLRDCVFHNNIIPAPIVNKEVEQETTHTEIAKFMIKPETFEAEGIEICIQNDEKLIGFLSSVKSKKGISAVVLSTANHVIILIKTFDLHPILVMIYPIDKVNVYAKSANLFYNLPLDDLMTKTVQEMSIANGYAFYYKKTIDPETQHVSTSLHYKLSNNVNSVAWNIREVNLNFVNLMLRPASILDVGIQKLRFNKNGLDNLNNINLLMLVGAQPNNNFKEDSKDYTISFDIRNGEEGAEFDICLKQPPKNESSYPIAFKKNAKIWKFDSLPCKHWEMYKHSVLLLQNVKSYVKTSSDHVYKAFGRFGQDYVYIKLLSSRGITNIDNASVIQLSKLLEGATYIFEMYFCHE